MFKVQGFGGFSIRFVALLAVLAALVILPLGAAAKGPAGVTGTLAVTAYDSWSGAGISGAAFQVWDDSGNLAAAGVAGASGYYQVILPQGQYKIVANAKNYSPNVMDVPVVVGKISRLNIPLDWSATNPPLPPSPSCCPGLRKY